MKKIFAFIICLLLSITSANAFQYSEVRAEHILVKTQAEVTEIQKKLESGENFEELAKEYSLCPSSRYGGDLGYFRKGQMVQPFEDTAFNMAIGEISEPIKTQYGWHIIKVLDKQ